MTTHLTGTDLFCGAGGSTTGAKMVRGVEMVMAVNHWDLAIETHNTNHPETDHVLTDISQCDPAYFPRTEFLLASPECTNHSLAKGRRRVRAQQLLPGFGEKGYDPAAERSRATMWDVVRFTEVHRYQFIVVENVVDARKWELFDAWANAMRALNYELEIVYLNSMFAETPQSRDRMYCVFWRKGNQRPNLSIRPKAYCPACDTTVAAVQSWKKDMPWGRYRDQYVYRCPHCAEEVQPGYLPAWTAVDWSLDVQRIGDRDRPLKEMTMKRIRYGLEKFADRPLLVPLTHTHSGERRAHPADGPYPTQTTRQDTGLAIPPFLMSYYTRESAISGVREPLPTVTGENRHALVVPPFMVELHNNSNVRGLDEPFSTVATSGAHHALAIPFLMQYYGTLNASAITEPVPTVTTVDRHALVTPAIDIDDVGFRMIQPHELQKAMAFPDEYVVLGTKREQVRQLGNAVTPPAMTVLVERCVEALA